ncbi:hypothetical protein EYF80_056509 [Liparis tanakae]|uniref:Uncharacterized protein n=1 Tax=Liparis tanakae TaxID=230148 RepID=A0A4Z2EXK0_9TELE|nr:hypothetical protein EYF80_056509 [Liparis tanakae]
MNKVQPQVKYLRCGGGPEEEEWRLRVVGLVVIRLNRNLKNRVRTRENHVPQSRVLVQDQPISCSQRSFSLQQLPAGYKSRYENGEVILQNKQ